MYSFKRLQNLLGFDWDVAYMQAFSHDLGLATDSVPQPDYLPNKFDKDSEIKPRPTENLAFLMDYDPETEKELEKLEDERSNLLK
jgi:hypothetical protein